MGCLCFVVGAVVCGCRIGLADEIDFKAGLTNPDVHGTDYQVLASGAPTDCGRNSDLQTTPLPSFTGSFTDTEYGGVLYLDVNEETGVLTGTYSGIVSCAWVVGLRVVVDVGRTDCAVV